MVKTISVRKGLAITTLFIIISAIIVAAFIIFLYMSKTGLLESLASEMSNKISRMLP